MPKATPSSFRKKWRECRCDKKVRADRAGWPCFRERQFARLRNNRRLGSSASFHHQLELAVLGETWVVIDLGHFQRAQRQHSILQLMIRILPKPLEPGQTDAGHAGDRLRRRNNLAGIDALPESEIVRIEKTG